MSEEPRVDTGKRLVIPNPFDLSQILQFGLGIDAARADEKALLMWNLFARATEGEQDE